MHPSIPAPAAHILDFIGRTEAPKGYDTVYGNRHTRMKKKITAMTFDEVVALSKDYGKKYGSGAVGRYQFMNYTLDKVGTAQDIKGEMGLTGRELFNADLQDRMGLHLLRRRGYDRFVAGTLSHTSFGLSLAKEWASFPVLRKVKGQKRQVERGQSFYAGDGMNKALVTPEAVESLLEGTLALANRPAVASPAPRLPDPPYPPPPPTDLGADNVAGDSRPPGIFASLLNGVLGRADAAAPISTPLPAEITKGDPAVYRMQTELIARGYYDGEHDGIIGGPGSKTRSGIRAAQADNGLPITGEMDKAFLAALTSIPARAVDPARKNATVADLKAAGSTPIAAATGIGAIGRILLGGGLLGGVDASGALDAVKNTADQVTATAGSVQTVVGYAIGGLKWSIEHWYLILLGLGVWYAFKGVKYALEIRALYRQGTITRSAA